MQQSSAYQHRVKTKSRSLQGKTKKSGDSELKSKKTKRKANQKVKRSGSATSNTSKASSITAGSKSITGTMSPLGSQSGNFTPANLRHFLRVNHLSHVIRTDMLAPTTAFGPYRVADHGKLITLGGIGKQAPVKDTNAKGNLFGSIALANRHKIRLIRLESLFQQLTIV